MSACTRPTQFAPVST